MRIVIRWLRQPRKTSESCLGSLLYRCVIFIATVFPGLLLVVIFVSLSISILLSLFDGMLDYAKWAFIVAIVSLIIRIVLHDQFSTNDKSNKINVSGQRG